MAQHVKDSALSLQRLGMLLWLRFSLCSRNFHTMQVQLENKQTKPNKQNPHTFQLFSSNICIDACYINPVYTLVSQ